MKNLYKILIVFSIVAVCFSCEDIQFNEEFLDQKPESVGFTIDTMFSSRQNADLVLNKAYSYNRFPFFSFFWPERMRGAGKGTYMDITDCGMQYGHTGAKLIYYSGQYNAGSNNFLYFSYLQDGAWDAIRYSYIYLENIDKVPDMNDDEKRWRRGEARCLIAYRYIEMLKAFGGVPWLDKSFKVNDTPKTIERATVEELVDNIVGLLDQAAKELPWSYASDNDYGRFTKASALGFKLETLLFAASPLFNADQPYHADGAANRYTWYGNYSVERWKRAEAAGKEFMDALTANGYYALVQASGSTHKDYRQAYIDGYHTRGKKECLYTIMPTTQTSEKVKLTWNKLKWYDPWSHRQCGVTTEYVNMFPMADGSDFPEDFDWANPAFNPFFDAAGNPNRDPRLYETVMINGDYYQGRTVETWKAANGFPKGRELFNNNNSAFYMRKFVQERNNATSMNKPINYAALRLPEVYLSYAEAINEANGGPNAMAYEMVNKVRNRVGLNDLPAGLSQEEFREACLNERALELGFEECRWYDLVRWKKEERLQMQLTGIKISKISNDGEFSYQRYNLPNRYFMSNWDTKWYLHAFPSTEIDKKYGLVQNPGW